MSTLLVCSWWVLWRETQVGASTGAVNALCCLSNKHLPTQGFPSALWNTMLHSWKALQENDLQYPHVLWVHYIAFIKSSTCRVSEAQWVGCATWVLAMVTGCSGRAQGGLGMLRAKWCDQSSTNPAYHRITEWPGLEETIRIILFHPTAMGRDTFLYPRLLRAPSKLVLDMFLSLKVNSYLSSFYRIHPQSHTSYSLGEDNK